MTRFENEMKYLIMKYVSPELLDGAKVEFQDIMKTTFKYCIAHTEYSKEIKNELNYKAYTDHEYHMAIHSLAEAILAKPDMLDIRYQEDYYTESKIYTLNIIK